MKKTALFVLVLLLTCKLNAQNAAKENVNSNKSTAIVFEAVENMPEYPGGDQALMTFIGNNVQYPVDAQEKGIQGTVITRFVVNTKGEVEKATIMRSVCPSLDAEAVRVINLLKGWKSGSQNGCSVNVYYTLPIRFKLSDETVQHAPTHLVKERQIVLLDGKRLAVGFDLSKIKASDYNIEVRKPETDAIKARLVEKYGADAEFGVVILTSKTKTENTLAKDTIQSSSQRIVSVEPDVMPTYPGGEGALMNFVSRNIRYPEDAREDNIQGTCTVRFVVNEFGGVESPAIIRSLCPSIDKESIRVISLLKGWKPGSIKGKAISAYFTLPIRFRLDTTNKTAPNWNR